MTDAIGDAAAVTGAVATVPVCVEEGWLDGGPDPRTLGRPVSDRLRAARTWPSNLAC